MDFLIFIFIYFIMEQHFNGYVIRLNSKNEYQYHLKVVIFLIHQLKFSDYKAVVIEY